MDWDQRYVDRDIPWDQDEHSPNLEWMFTQERARLGEPSRVLVPGCGLGHDAAFLARQGHSTIGVDLSATAVAHASARYQHPKLEWLVGDLFSELPESSFDLIWEYTCYCAIPPTERANYVRVMHQTLRPGGQVLGTFLMDTGGDPGSGPPYMTTMDELTQTFGAWFDLQWERPSPVVSEGWEDREHLMLWKRRADGSQLSGSFPG